METGSSRLRERLQEALGESYVLERELGGGGMSRVFVATDARLGRRVVVKVLHPDLAASLSAQRFEREVRLAAGLQHPHLVPVHASGEVGGLPYYTMPYIEGESLRQRFAREGALALGDAVRLVRELADALAYAHGHGIVHRDLKPENVLLSGGHAMVADFGVAKALSAATQDAARPSGADGGATLDGVTGLGIAVGTPAYMAPEQAASDPATDHRADLYALGVLAYEAIAGTHPFGARTAAAMLAAHLTEPPVPLHEHRRDVPPALEALVTRFLAKRPEDRPQGAQEVVRALDTTSTRVAGTVATRGARARPPRAAVLGAALLVVAGTGALVWARRPTTSEPRETITSGTGLGATRLVERRVAVVPFENQTGDSALAPLGRLTSEWVSQGLAEAGLAEVADPQTVQLAWGRSTSPGALGAATGARLIVSGAYYREGDTLRMLARVTDAADGKLLRAVESVGAPAMRQREAVAALRERVLGALGGLLNARMARYSSPAALPPSLAAYRHWATALELQLRGEFREAISEHLAAARVDSAFSMPLLSAANIYASHFGEHDTADSLFAIVEKSRDRLAPAEQSLLDAWRAENRGDYAGALRAAREAARLNPASPGPGVSAWNALRVNRPREAVAGLASQETDIRFAFAPNWDLLTLSHHLLGEYEAELAAATRGRRLHPTYVGLRVDEARALAALGRAQAVERRLDELLDLPADRQRTLDVEMRSIGRELRVHGHEAAAQAAFARALRWLDERPAGEQQMPALRARRAETLYAAGRWDESRRLFEALAAEQPDEMDHRGYVGALAARRGDRAAALAVDSMLASMRGPYLLGRPPYWRARIAALLGEPDRAVALLREALQQGCTYVWDVHPEADFESLRDVPAFRELVRVRG